MVVHNSVVEWLISVLCLVLIACTLAGAAKPAHADGCENLDQNPEWQNGFDQLILEFQSENWKEAIRISRQLEGICEFSPALNYTIARIHKNRNDNEKYLFYLQKATQNTERFAVDKNLLDKMWSEKYIVAHPEASPESIESYKQQIESLQHANADKSEEMKVYKSVMWAGTGIGIGGLAVAGAGLAMALTSEPAEFYSGHGNAPDQYEESLVHSAGWALVGVGGAMTVIGAVLAGVYGYKYKHFFDNNTVSVQLSGYHNTFSIHF